MNAPTQVNLLHVSKEVAVETSHFHIHIAAHHQRSSGGPKYVDRFAVVILSVVGLHRIEYSASAIGIAVAVEKSACRSGIFKEWLLAVVVL